jgi:hypothetical protein
MTTSSPRPTTVQPYPPGTQWTFSARRHNFTQTKELVLYPEPNGSAITDDYLAEEISAVALWRMWVDKYANYYHRRWPNQYRPGEVHIYWTVTEPKFTGTFEAAPHTLDTPPDPDMARLFGGMVSLFGEEAQEGENFLTHFTDPVNADTGERLNWLRLPVMDRAWNATASNKGGFIQEATGWKPSPLQPTMDVVRIAAAAGLYVPKLT